MRDQNNLPQVTVGIPAYNRPVGLEKTLECIVNQTYKNLHILVSDNCSTDETVLQILKKYAAKDNRVKFIVQKENLSIIPNFQYLLDNAVGEYFMWAADDDQWDFNFIEVCVEAMQSNNDIVLCMTDIYLQGEDKTEKIGNLNRGFMQNSIYKRCFNYIKSNIENKFFLCGVYRLQAVKGLIFPNYWGGEHMFLLEVVTKGKFMYIKDKSIFHYFLGGNSKSTESIKKAFNIKRKFAFIDAYVLKFVTSQFLFKHLSILQKSILFFSNSFGLLLNEDKILYYNLVKKPLKEWLKKTKQ